MPRPLIIYTEHINPLSVSTVETRESTSNLNLATNSLPDDFDDAGSAHDENENIPEFIHELSSLNTDVRSLIDKYEKGEEKENTLFRSKSLVNLFKRKKAAINSGIKDDAVFNEIKEINGHSPRVNAQTIEHNLRKIKQKVEKMNTELRINEVGVRENYNKYQNEIIELLIKIGEIESGDSLDIKEEKMNVLKKIQTCNTYITSITSKLDQHQKALDRTSDTEEFHHVRDLKKYFETKETKEQEISVVSLIPPLYRSMPPTIVVSEDMEEPYNNLDEEEQYNINMSDLKNYFDATNGEDEETYSDIPKPEDKYDVKIKELKNDFGTNGEISTTTSHEKQEGSPENYDVNVRDLKSYFESNENSFPTKGEENNVEIQKLGLEEQVAQTLQQIEAIWEELEKYQNEINAFAATYEDDMYSFVNERLENSLIRLENIDVYYNDLIEEERQKAMRYALNCLNELTSKLQENREGAASKDEKKS